MLEKIEKFQIIILSAILALGLIIATTIVSNSLPNDGITVTGSASKIVKSDKGSLYFNITTRNKSRRAGYETIKRQLPIIKSYLISKGIKEEDINIKTTNCYNTYKILPNGNSSNEVEYYNIQQPVEIKSDKVDTIRDISTDITSLMSKGIDLDVNMPEYYYSKISDLKVELLNEASKDAKQRATAMLKATHNRTGKIQSVKMGVFQITSPNSTNVSDSGIYDTESVEKKVTAVANVVFKIK